MITHRISFPYTNILLVIKWTLILLKIWLQIQIFLASIKYCSTIDDNDLKKPIPVFNAYYWQTNETNIDPLHLTFSYEEICKYPYYYKDEDLSVTGKVIYEELNSSGNRATLLIQKGTLLKYTELLTKQKITLLY